MKNAGQTFVRAIQLILKPLKEFADPYIDDSAVHSNIWCDHLIHIEEFLTTMRSESLTLNRLNVSHKIPSHCGFTGFTNIETRLDQCPRMKSTYHSS